MLDQSLYKTERVTDRELLETFPEAREIVSEKLAEWRRRLNAARRIAREMGAVVQTLALPHERWVMGELIKAWITPHLRLINGHIVRLDRLQSLLLNIPRLGQLCEEEIVLARNVPIRQVVDMPLRQSGQTLAAHCSLHDDCSPSFHVYLKTNSWYCFGCKQGGDTIQFIRLRYGLTFKDAVRYLHHHYG